MKSIFCPLIAILVSMLCLLSSCSGSSVDYSTDIRYQAIFSEGEDADTKALKNVILAHLEAYNAGDAEAYYSLFSMEKEDLNFNIAQFDAMRQSCVLTYTPEAIKTAFINENNAQAMITMTCRAEDLNTGEVLYYYRTDLTYTMVRDGKWKVTLQTPGAEEDLMDSLTETSPAEKTNTDS